MNREAESVTPECLITLLRERVGFDVAQLNMSAIRHTTEAFQRKLGLDDSNALCRRLGESLDDWQAFIDEVINPETWFFREADSLTSLDRLMHDRIANRHLPLELLSLPCSSGEEPYTLACYLQGHGHAPGDYRIDAVDICQRALRKARNGVYREYSFRGGAGERVSSFGEWQEEGFRLGDVLRRGVHFHHGNLLERDSLPSGQYDVVLCRNLLIYFHLQGVERAMETLRQLLRPDGLLIVALAESSLVCRARFEPRDAGRSCCFRLRERVDTRSDAQAQQEFPTPQATSFRKSTVSRSERVDRQRHQELLDEARRLADSGDYPRAREICEQLLSRQPELAEGHFLLGVVNVALKRPDLAAACMRTTLELDPRHIEARICLTSLETGD